MERFGTIKSPSEVEKFATRSGIAGGCCHKGSSLNARHESEDGDQENGDYVHFLVFLNCDFAPAYMAFIMKQYSGNCSEKINAIGLIANSLRTDQSCH